MVCLFLFSFRLKSPGLLRFTFFRLLFVLRCTNTHNTQAAVFLRVHVYVAHMEHCSVSVGSACSARTEGQRDVAATHQPRCFRRRQIQASFIGQEGCGRLAERVPVHRLSRASEQAISSALCWPAGSVVLSRIHWFETVCLLLPFFGPLCVVVDCFWLVPYWFWELAVFSFFSGGWYNTQYRESKREQFKAQLFEIPQSNTKQRQINSALYRHFPELYDRVCLSPSLLPLVLFRFVFRFSFDQM